MKFKTLFKCLSGLTACSSLIPVVMSLNRTHTHTQDSLNVGNSSQSNAIEWNITDDGAIKPTNKTQVVGDIRIPSSVIKESKIIKVTSIAERAFQDCSSLSTVLLPRNLETIDFFAFGGCTSLKNIVFPDRLKEIRSNSFQDCSSLGFVSFNWGLRVINANAFMGCNSLKTIVIPETVSFIDSFAFVNCKSLTNIYLNWNYWQLDNIYKYSHGIYYYPSPLGLWCGLFAFEDEKTREAINRTNETNIYLPNDASNDLVNLYKKTFDAVYLDTEAGHYSGMGLDPKLTHFIGGQQKENKTDYGLILAAVFGSISLIWLSGLNIYLVKKHSKKKNKK